MNNDTEINRSYEKKDIIYSATMGLCVVSDVTRLSADKNTPPVPYYVLKSYYDKTHVAYIPVEDHKVELRDVISESEAVERFERLCMAYQANSDYRSDMLVVGEIAYVYRCTPYELLKRAGAPAEAEE